MMRGLKHIQNYILLIITAMILSSCGTYGSRFSSAPARGEHSLMVSQVDEQISSGEAEKLYSKPGKGGSLGGYKKMEEYPTLHFDLDIDDLYFVENDGDE